MDFFGGRLRRREVRRELTREEITEVFSRKKRLSRQEPVVGKGGGGCNVTPNLSYDSEGDKKEGRRE